MPTNRLTQHCSTLTVAAARAKCLDRGMKAPGRGGKAQRGAAHGRSYRDAKLCAYRSQPGREGKVRRWVLTADTISLRSPCTISCCCAQRMWTQPDRRSNALGRHCGAVAPQSSEYTTPLPALPQAAQKHKACAAPSLAGLSEHQRQQHQHRTSLAKAPACSSCPQCLLTCQLQH